ncbi:hypothetical protein BDZ91DRAFT_729736 [Kalaharituber pfeilii]|nr:hypothetical protein BDZ91DRAFT_729736 [Kalaharituber pfeilii]
MTTVILRHRLGRLNSRVLCIYMRKRKDQPPTQGLLIIVTCLCFGFYFVYSCFVSAPQFKYLRCKGTVFLQGWITLCAGPGGYQWLQRRN